ncbi:MAG: fibrinogen-like YCDxxxxGGGW domain-containing protein [Myxococcota bacterium]
MGWLGKGHEGAVVSLLLAVACATGDPFEPNLGLGDEGTASGSTTSSGAGETDGSDGGDGPVMTSAPGTTAEPPGTSTGPEEPETTTSGGPCTPSAWARDDDDDGYGDPNETVEACEAPPGHVADATDCDDGDETVFPGANEPCGGPDKNCDFVAPALCNSCLQLLGSGNGDDSGLYTIDVDGPDEPLPPAQVYCDQQTDGGGWTLVQRTVWDPAQTNALRTGYAAWHDQTLGNPSPGQGYRLQGAAWGNLNLQLEHMLRHDIRQTDGTACEPLFYLGSSGELTVSDTQALLTGLTADVAMVGSTELSTVDSGPSTNCVATNLGVPWFFGQCCATCPVYQGGYWTEPHPMVSYVHSTPDLTGQVETDVCSGTPELAINGSVYRGLDAMEYYLR